MKEKDRVSEKQNNSGFTLVEMVVAFALLALFMVAATRVISYTIGIYYAAKGSSDGMQVAGMIANKVSGQIEGASRAMNPVVTKGGNGIDSLSFIDATGSRVTISASPQRTSDGETEGSYVNIHYDAVTEGSIQYEDADWRFDRNAYLGYVVKELRFENPGDDYPDNVLRMTLVLHSGRYGDYSTSYYIKCVNVDEIEF
ncbi:MAG: type II secretion system protein J [Butyrivibrio sp.]